MKKWKKKKMCILKVLNNIMKNLNDKIQKRNI